MFDSIISFISKFLLIFFNKKKNKKKKKKKVKEISEDINLFKAIEDPNRRNEIFKNLISEIKEK